jgi:hypothetical protein
VPDQPSWIIEKLHKRHDRTAFSCGVAELDEYLHRFAGQKEKAGINQHFVAVAAASDIKVLGYHELSAGSVAWHAISMSYGTSCLLNVGNESMTWRGR